MKWNRLFWYPDSCWSQWIVWIGFLATWTKRLPLGLQYSTNLSLGIVLHNAFAYRVFQNNSIC